MITDGSVVCARCLDYKATCALCIGMPEHLIPTPKWILDEEKELSESMNNKLDPWICTH